MIFKKEEEEFSLSVERIYLSALGIAGLMRQKQIPLELLDARVTMRQLHGFPPTEKA